MATPLVSITCAAYNHEAYIARALDGFLSQQTDFGFEILVHDDASTDRTADIIRDYARRWPDLVLPLFQTENQYSLGKRIPYLNTQRARGRYIAVCEGDDYWTDPHKLQKQVAFLEAHPECSLLFHAADILDERTGQISGQIRPFDRSLILPAKPLFSGGGNICPTASIVYRSEPMRSPPDFYFQSPVGDRALALTMVLHGSIAYLDDVMSVRRLWVPGSWNTRFQHEPDKQKQIRHFRGMISLFESFGQVSGGRWSDDVNRTVLGYQALIARLENHRPLADPNCRRGLARLAVRDRAAFVFKWARQDLRTLLRRGSQT